MADGEAPFGICDLRCYLAKRKNFRRAPDNVPHYLPLRQLKLRRCRTPRTRARAYLRFPGPVLKFSTWRKFNFRTNLGYIHLNRVRRCDETRHAGVLAWRRGALRACTRARVLVARRNFTHIHTCLTSPIISEPQPDLSALPLGRMEGIYNITATGGHRSSSYIYILRCIQKIYSRNTYTPGDLQI